MIKKIVRDNPVVNAVVRNVLRFLGSRFGAIRRLANRYPVYGTAHIEVEGIQFGILSKSDDLIASALYYGRNFEPHEFRLVRSVVRQSSTFVDVGANTGIFSLFAAKANSKLKVICYEPHPSNYRRLSQNVSLNKLKNVSCVEAALGERDSSIKFTIPADGRILDTPSANAAFTRNFYPIGYKEISVRQTTLNNALADAGISSRDLVKIDVEYYELNVLRGAEEILRNGRPFVMIELLMYDELIDQFPSMKEQIDPGHAVKIQEFMQRLGYHPYSIGERGVNLVESVKNAGGNRNFFFVYGKPVAGLIPFENIVSALGR